MFRKVVFEVFFSRFCALRRALKIPLLTLVSLPISTPPPTPYPLPKKGRGQASVVCPTNTLLVFSSHNSSVAPSCLCAPKGDEKGNREVGHETVVDAQGRISLPDGLGNAGQGGVHACRAAR